MFYAANIPVDEKINDKKIEKFKFGLSHANQYGRRPHFLYGTKEQNKNAIPITLPPLQNT